MSQWKELKPEEWNESVFRKVGKQWMLVTAEKEGKVNTMTASWGGLGILWGKPVAFVFIRPQRYTKEFVDQADRMSLSFLGEEYRKELSYLGTVSGRDEDKIAKAGLTVVHEWGNDALFRGERERADLPQAVRPGVSRRLLYRPRN